MAKNTRPPVCVVTTLFLSTKKCSQAYLHPSHLGRTIYIGEGQSSCMISCTPWDHRSFYPSIGIWSCLQGEGHQTVTLKKINLKQNEVPGTANREISLLNDNIICLAFTQLNFLSLLHMRIKNYTSSSSFWTSTWQEIKTVRPFIKVRHFTNKIPFFFPSFLYAWR